MGIILPGAVSILLAVQATQGTVAGTVRDQETGEPLAGAVVSLTELHRATATDADGRYLLRQVPAGPQHLTVRFIGHSPRTLDALVPGDGRLEINVSLRRVPYPLPSIDVHPPITIRGVDGGDGSAFPDRSSSIAAVRNHPLLAEPDVLQALGGGEVVLKPESPSGVHIRGGGSEQTAYLLDGIPVFSPYHAAGVFSAWNPDALTQLHLSSAAPSPADPATLSGTVAAVTRTPGARLNVQGSVSTTQARLTLDGPLGGAGGGYLVSGRSGFPGFVASNEEASYLRGGTGDWLAKLEAPVFGGRVRLLGYDSENEITTAATAAAENGPGQSSPSSRNGFQWRSRSLGAEWRGHWSGIGARILTWSAVSDASAAWTAPTGRVAMTAARRDEGLLAAVEQGSPRASIVAGIRVERSRTAFRIESDSGAAPSWSVSARTPVATLFAQYARPLSPPLHLRLGAAVAAAGAALHLAPRAQLQWEPSDRLTLSGSYAGLHQFAQSLRNPESVVGGVFPVDLYLGAGAPGVPVARSDQGVIAADYRPLPGVRFGVQAYQRRFQGLLLVAPRDGGPFTTRAFAVGVGTSRGASIEAAVSAARYGLVGSYGVQRVRLAYGDSGYVPDHAATHLVEGGLIVFPAATLSIRLGATGALGRRTTPVSGGLEFESCNLLDQGCEFGGSPNYGGESLGETALPAYFRVDLGVRKHWHLRIGGRDAAIALFGTITNLLGRKNVLTYSRDPSTGQPVEIEMRRLAPLVVGLEWRF